MRASLGMVMDSSYWAGWAFRMAPITVLATSGFAMVEWLAFTEASSTKGAIRASLRFTAKSLRMNVGDGVSRTTLAGNVTEESPIMVVTVMVSQWVETTFPTIR